MDFAVTVPKETFYLGPVFGPVLLCEVTVTMSAFCPQRSVVTFTLLKVTFCRCLSRSRFFGHYSEGYFSVAVRIYKTCFSRPATGTIFRGGVQGPLLEHKTCISSLSEAFIIDPSVPYNETASVYEVRRYLE